MALPMCSALRGAFGRARSAATAAAAWREGSTSLRQSLRLCSSGAPAVLQQQRLHALRPPRTAEPSAFCTAWQRRPRPWERQRRSIAAAASQQQQQQGSQLARSVRPVPITVLTVGKGNSRGAELMAAEWADKLRRYTRLTELQIKPNPKNAKETAVAVAHEGERVLKSIAPGDRVVLLDERGRDISSEDLARLLAQASDQGWPSLVFCIGGPFGHAPAVRERGNDVIRLSRMVLNHQVAHVVLMEQLYRAWTILKGEPYHH